jgi:Amt family ammonium transporter
MFLSWILSGKPSAGMLLNGVLAGLVGITAGCAAVTPSMSIIIGAIGGVAMFAGTRLLLMLKIDDPVGAIPVHGISGLWGILAVGLFAADGGLFMGGGSELLMTQIIGAAAIILWTAVTSAIMYGVIHAIVGLRVDGKIEEEGLDAHEHGEIAYIH